MGTYRDFIETRKKEWVGKKVKYEGKIYNVTDVDYNGFLLIDKPTKYNADTAVSILDVEVI